MIIFYPIEAPKFEIFDLKCGYKSGHLDINLKFYQKNICCCPFTQISGLPNMYMHRGMCVISLTRGYTVEFRLYRAHTYGRERRVFLQHIKIKSDVKTRCHFPALRILLHREMIPRSRNCNLKHSNQYASANEYFIFLNETETLFCSR